jgi:hypothetical protein
MEIYPTKSRYFFVQQRDDTRPRDTREGRGYFWRNIVGAMAILGLLFAFAGCSSGAPQGSTGTATPTPVPQTPTPTVQSVPVDTVLYHTDWSQGVSGWKVPGQMTTKASKGKLEVTCNDNATMFANYRPTVAKYALEVAIQIVNVPSNGGTFNLVGQQSPGSDGFVAGTASLEKKFPFHGQIDTYVDPTSHSTTFYDADYSPGTKWVTYRIEVQNGVISLFVNGTRHGQAASTVTNDLTTGPLGLSCGGIVLNLGPLRITAL